jgi:BirA family biotin operon repressor/biotin-[acetyl-CoA-carboxylase] ligase
VTDPAAAIVDRWEGNSAEHWRREWRVPQLVILSETTSTNDALRSLADAGAPAGAIAIAERQTAGRGQAGRTWTSPPGKSLLFSILLRNDTGTDGAPDPSTTPIRVGLALCNAITRASGLDVRIKWPNDIVHEGKKLAGILCEGASGATGSFVVAGIGVNIHQVEDDWPLDLRAPATSLLLATGRNVSRAALVAGIVERLRPFRLEGELGPSVLTDFRDHDALFGRRITLDDGNTVTACGIDAHGALLVQSGLGIRTIRAGSVRLSPTQDSLTGPP